MMKRAQIQDLKAAHCHSITAITKPQIATLRKQDVFQIEQCTEKLCEIASDGMRYLVRSNPKRVEERAQTRHNKIHKVQRFLTRQNAYLAQHQRAKVAVALRKSTQGLQQLKVSEFAHVEAQERHLSLTLDAKKHAAISALDGGYVIKTDLPQEEVAAETVHQRDKDLAFVEQGFRTIKTGLLETRPIFVRKEQRTKGHVLVVMLAYILVQELQTLWAEMHITVEEGLLELSMLTTMEIQIGHTGYQQIPQPREVGRKLLELAHVSLPEALPSRNIKVATRKRLTRG
jgi:transposase